MQKAEHPAGHLFREAYGELVALMVGKYGMSLLDEIEDAIQESLLRAMQQWGYGQVPEKPKAWLYTVARNRLVDVLRRERRILDSDPADFRTLQAADTDPPDHLPDDRVVEDSRLRMIFACCHPSLKPRQQLLLSLKLVAGFSNAEVGRALIRKEHTVARAYTRAKNQLKEVLETLEATHAIGLRSRITIVNRVLYVLFTEGYQPTRGDLLLKKDMCHEAIRLALILRSNPYFANSETEALLALMCFHCARFEARLDRSGRIADLSRQDRSLYNRELIEIGREHLNRSHGGSASPSGYHLEAGISLLHCTAKDFESTDWKAILLLYDEQLKRQYSPMAALNRLVPLVFAQGPAPAQAAYRALTGRHPELEEHHLAHAISGLILRKANCPEAATQAYQRAAALTTNDLEAAHYQRMASE